MSEDERNAHFSRMFVNKAEQDHEMHQLELLADAGLVVLLTPSVGEARITYAGYSFLNQNG